MNKKDQKPKKSVIKRGAKLPNRKTYERKTDGLEIKEEPRKERRCFICGKLAMMSRFQRFCTDDCRQRATDIARGDLELIRFHPAER